MSKDPYEILGVNKDASQDDIRKAYRELAKKHHPDLHPGDRSAEERFKAVSAAYAILGDAEKRARFDRGEIDASGAERPEQQFYRRHAETEAGHRYWSAAGHEDFADISEIFADLFGQRAEAQRRGSSREFRMRGGDVRYRMAVDFMEAAKGTHKRITLPDGSMLDVAIPPGVKSGQTLRLRGKGQPGLGGGEPGDALVQIEVSAHPHFAREGADILLELPITIDEAVLGGRVEVPTIAGPVRMTVPKGSSSGDVLRLKGKGIHEKGAKKAGDQLVRLRVVLPKEIDEGLEKFMKEWRTGHGYDPRRKLKAGA